MLSINNKIQICIAVNFALLIIISSFIFTFADRKMLRIGYSNDLIVLGIAIDNWQKYLSLHICIFLQNFAILLYMNMQTQLCILMYLMLTKNL